MDDECVVGHNILMDFSFLKRAAVNCGLTFERGGIDTLRLSRVFLLELQSRTLPALCQHFQIDHNPHRALDDVMATYDLYKKLKEKKRGPSLSFALRSKTYASFLIISLPL